MRKEILNDIEVKVLDERCFNLAQINKVTGYHYKTIKKYLPSIIENLQKNLEVRKKVLEVVKDKW
jgi:hypothetical protein